MNDHSTAQNDDPRDEHAAEIPASETTSSELVSRPDDPPHAPPLDVDERPHHADPPEVIALPDHGDPTDVAHHEDDAYSDEINEHMPLPMEEDYHDDDSVASDPHDVDDPLDLTLPLPTGDARGEVDDFSTLEELDVETSSSTFHDAQAWNDGLPDESLLVDPSSFDDAVGPVDAGEHDPLEIPAFEPPITYPTGADDDPVNHESDFYSMTFTSDAADLDAEEDVPSITQALTATEEMPEAETPLPPPLIADGTTTCPACGRQTDALRFCGYCGAHLTEERRISTATSFTGRIQERAEIWLDPVARWTRPGTVRFLVAAGLLLVLLALLANNGALALIFGAAILPLILIFWAMHNDVFENEPPTIIAGFGLAGILTGAILGWLGSIIVTSSWFETGILNYGAAGYGGVFAERAGNAPFLVWALVGIVLPLLALAAILAGPLAMRQTVSLRNEVMDGLTLGAVMGAGYSIGTAIVFASPMLAHGGPISDASGWTLTTIGLTIIRPLIWTLSGGLLGAAAWRYLITGSIRTALTPAIVGTAVPLLFTLMSIQLSPTGLWPEIFWGVLMATIAGFFYRKTMEGAITQDRRVLGNDNSRTVCPSCHRVTLSGQFCAHCGGDLASPSPSTAATGGGESGGAS